MRFVEKEYPKSINYEKLENETGLNEITTKILASRGYDTAEKIDKFLNPTEKDLNDPFLLDNMQQVIERIKLAINLHKRILIFGDYDVDGISAVAILYKYFEKMNVRVDYFLPNRYEDGYGLTMETADKVISEFNPELIITVDCGISCYKEVEYLQSKGIEVIVTDHHEIPEIVPNCLILNAKMPNQKYPFRELCGAGMAFKIVEALGENIYKYLPIAAIATVADIVSLTDENRAIVVLGLKHFENIPKGIKLLLNELKIKEINSQDIAFRVAPKLNAAGRMGDARVALQLFINNDQEQLFQSLVKLTEMNIERQNRCNKVYEDALNKLNSINANRQKCIILQSKDWDSGLLGIVCARLVEDYNKPTFLFSNCDGVLKGSVRSIKGINIHDALSSCKSLLETFGGHCMAAGLTLNLQNYDKFKDEINSYFNQNYGENYFLPEKCYDMKLDIKQINTKMIKELDRLEPFGCDNPKPIFMIEWEKSNVKQMTNYPQHLNIILNGNISLVAFNSANYLQNIQYNSTKQALVELQINKFNGKESIKCLTKSFNFIGYNKLGNDMLMGNYSKQCYFDDEVNENFVYVENIFDKIKYLFDNSKFGTLIICNSNKMLEKFLEEMKGYEYNFHFAKIQSKDATNSLVVCLNNYDNILNFTNIVFLEPIIYKNYVSNFKGRIYVPKNERFLISNLKLNLSREYFLEFYTQLKTYCKSLILENEYTYYQELKKLSPNINNLSYTQFICLIKVFEELGLIKITNDFRYSIETVEGKKTKLENSKIYQKLNYYYNK